ncbi:MAG: Fur family transcriptional regulator [Prevotella sp.]
MTIKHDTKETVKNILYKYLEQNHLKKTPERFAILDAAYSFDRYFTIDELDCVLCKDNFPVSRATLYNTIKLLMRLKLISATKLENGVRYKVGFTGNGCFSVCTICGKMSEITVPEIENIFSNIRLKRFRKENFSMCIYGICSTCQASITRKNKKTR